MPRVVLSDVDRDVTTAFSHGRKSSVGTSAVQMNTSSIVARKGVIVKAAAANTGKVYVGNSSSVTADSSDSTDGFELSAGDSILVPVNNVNLIYLIASAASQKVFWALA